ncbi:MAG: O-antigen ligase family protein [Gemmatimonadales bacterium]|nr:O-antigen ligase family protein [Gemmatimonadales bacterium]
MTAGAFPTRRRLYHRTSSDGIGLNWGEMTTPERWITGYFTALPILWLLGLLLPVALLVVFGTLVRFVRSPRSYALSLPWLFVALGQSVAVGYNMVEQGQPVLMLAKHALSSYVLGWYVLWASICIGASGLVRPGVFVRAVARVGFYFVLLGLVAYAIALLSDAPFLFLRSPVGRLMPPELAATNFSFGIFVYAWDNLFGTVVPRLCLFFPWTSVAGYAGIFLIFITANEAEPRRRRLAVLSGLFMVAASLSRLAWVACVACLAFRWFLGWRSQTRYLGAAFGLAVAVLGVIIVGTPDEAVREASEAIESARPDASQARNFIYGATWKAIDDAPVIGHGWPGGAAVADVSDSLFGGGGPSMVVGSHSTVSGLIYKGGWLTFSLFVVAMLYTAGMLMTARANPAIAHSALALLLSVALTCVGESLESLIVPTLFGYVWIGIALDRCQPPHMASPEQKRAVLPRAPAG